MGRRRTKPFMKSEGIFYFTVWTRNVAITIKRKTFREARKAFEQYKRQGKQCEWLGRWTGKQFDESQRLVALKG